MTRPVVLLNTVLPEQAQQLAETAFEIRRTTQATGDAIADGDLTTARAMITAPSTGAPSSLIAAMPALELIAVTGAGLDLVDTDLARRRGIEIYPTGGWLAEDVADTALMLMMATVRTLLKGDQLVRSGGWASARLPLTRSAHSRRVGLVGFGSIGQALARRLAAMNCDIRYFSRRPVPERTERHEPDLRALADWAEVLVLALPGGAATEGLIDASILAALGPQGVLINVARGSVVREEDLIVALQTGGIAGAGLDVFENEPQPDPRFRDLTNTVYMPHCGSASVEAREAAAGEAVRRVMQSLTA
ncbi:NAD(P)-dependent oxidoreductase [Pseudooceanicola sp. C21-150M6]|uniref:NAD(P)-dependent oxidoreductase n=1 Tax=Pseudooceanicola sp. C21-150M6 TaxID=3434355 RepID=UPI003D7F8A88